MSISLAEAYFIALGCEIFLHGMYTALWLVSMYLLLFKRKRTTVIIVMTVLNIVMWIVATSHMAISFEQNYHAFLFRHAADDPTVWEDNASPNIYSQISLEAVNIIIGDGIVIWRAWILWGRKWWVIFTSGTLLTGTLAAAVGIIRAYTMAPPGITVFDNPTLSTWAIAFISSTLTTNLWATSLVAYRTWSHNKQNGILAILIESGVFYACTWFVAIITFACGTNGIYPVIDILSQLTAIYPTLIITLVCLRSTLDVAIETFQQTTHEWAVRPGTVRSPEDVLTAASYPLNTLRIGVQTRTDSSDPDQFDSIRSGLEGSMISDKPRSISYNGVRPDDKFDVV
ncbi:hypothetical protein IW261DRAFT_146816 [Armillaria novae-zelandiae]|uniref:Uncharacterized protein n=1 Tax=Armillaria novae-zelandiae TaxID=153914 RepID=A0AA39TC99_9AGAR|nr:hypothetical protein IW261DRAFT_146816 [Armillaria novae-zelandiae]